MNENSDWEDAIKLTLAFALFVAMVALSVWRLTP